MAGPVSESAPGSAVGVAGASLPSVAMIVPVMDHAADLRISLPSLLSQDYASYGVYIVGASSVGESKRH